MKKLILITAAMLVITEAHRAQEYLNMMARADQYTFAEIQAAADVHFSEVGTGKGSGYKQYMRWAIMAEPRLDGDGKVVNRTQKSLEGYRNYINSEYYRSLPAEKSNTGSWESIGPSNYNNTTGWNGGNGRINVIAVHPTNSSIIFAGSASGGLWKSTNNGGSWIPLTDGMPSLGVSGICIHPTNPNIIYILTGDGDGRDTPCTGVMKTTDGGITWKSSEPFLGTGVSLHPAHGGLSFSSAGYKLVMNPTSPDVLLAATSDGIFQTTNGGVTWINRKEGEFRDIVFRPGNSNVLYATSIQSSESLNQFWTSFDGGFSWNATGTGLPTTDFRRVSIGVTPANPLYIYLLYGGETTGFRGLYRSTTGGGAFELRSNSPNIMGNMQDGSGTLHQAWYDIAIAVSPTNEEVVLVGGINIWRSNNGGTTWTVRSDWYQVPFINNNANYCHADIHHLSFQDGTLWVGSDGGVYRSDDLGNSFENRSSGLRIMQYYKICTGSNVYIGGTQDNGTNETFAGNTTANHILGADGFECFISPTNPNTLFMSTQSGHSRRDPFGFITPISPDTGDTWNVGWINNPVFFDYMYLGHFGKVYRSQNQGLTWTNMGGNFGSGNRVLHLAMNPLNALRLYAGTLSQIKVTNNANSASPTWTTLTNNIGSGFVFSGLATSPVQDRVYVLRGGYNDGSKVFTSTDGGATWSNISGNLPNVHVSCLAAEDSNGGIYVGTDIGVFYRNNTIGNWIPFTNGLPTTIITELEIRSGENRIYAGTHGRGLWRSTLYEPCPNNYTLTPANDPSNAIYTGFQYYTASNQITSTRQVTGGEGTDVSYLASANVTLLPGFEARFGNEFEAKIGECNALYQFIPEPPGGIYAGMLRIDEEFENQESIVADDQVTFDLNLQLKNRVFPNPFSDHFTVELAAQVADRNFSITLYDLKGQLLQQHGPFLCPQGLRITLPIITNRLAPGMYLLHINEGITSEIFKVVKQP